MDDDFDYIVSPDVFNVDIKLIANGWKVDRVFGSPGYEIPKAGTLAFLDSTFPSRQEKSGMTKGGVVLAKLSKNSGNPDNNITVKVEYEDKHAKKYQDSSVFQFPTKDEVFDNLSVRKAVLLVRYVNFFKQFIRDQNASLTSPSVNAKSGIVVPSLVNENPSSHKYSMEPLNAEYKDTFKKFIDHFEKEMDVIEESQLEKELSQLTTIYESNQQTPSITSPTRMD